MSVTTICNEGLMEMDWLGKATKCILVKPIPEFERDEENGGGGGCVLSDYQTKTTDRFQSQTGILDMNERVSL